MRRTSASAAVAGIAALALAGAVARADSHRRRDRVTAVRKGRRARAGLQVTAVTRRRLNRAVRSGLRTVGYDLVRFPVLADREAHLIELFSRLDINCVLDVGAHHGEFASTLRRIGYMGQIISFEPVSGSLEILEDRARGDLHWSIERYALGSRNESKTINVTRGTSLASFSRSTDIARARFGELTEIVAQQEVEVRRLDEVLADLPQQLSHCRLFLKLDTQGWDLEVLAGASRVIPQILAVQSEISVKPLYMESPSYFDAIEQMNKMGFELSGMFAVARDHALRVIEFDCVAIRADPPS
jgi:FkbM family methyltransferase